MIRKGLIEHVKCRWREFLREPSACFWVIFMPVLWMVVLGIAFSNPKPDLYGVGLITGTSQNIRQANDTEKLLKSSSQIKLKMGGPEEIERGFKRGEIVLALEWNEDMLSYRFDRNSPESNRARTYVDALIQEAAGRKNPVLTDNINFELQGQRYIDFLIPGLLGLSLMSSSLFGTGLTIVANRKDNLLKRYLATPMYKSDYLISHIIGRLFVFTAEFLAIAIAAYFIFDFEVNGSMISYVGFAILGAFSFTSMALLCASRIKNVPFMAGLVNLISIPSILLSGVFFSKSNFPDSFLGFINHLPLTALNDGLRKIALEGSSAIELGHESLVLVVYLIVALVLSRFSFRWF